MPRNPAAPSGISARAKRVWTSVLDEYELREDERAILTDYVQELTICDHLQSELEGADTLMRASHGGIQVNPIYSELRQHRSSAMQLWKSLKLPDHPGDEEDEPDNVRPMTRSESGKKAAQARWGKSG